MEGQNQQQQNKELKNDPLTRQETNETNTINVGVPVPINHVSVNYACQFYVEPKVLKYYYAPPATDFEFGKPILQGSSVFDGPCGSKWQVTTTFNRWIGVERWVSLYLTRRKEESNNGNNELLYLHCEFRIVDKDGNVLRSMRNKLTPAMNGGETRGFTKFMPFTDMKKVITEDNWLKVEAHITFLHKAAPETLNIPQPAEIKNTPITEDAVAAETIGKAGKTNLTIKEYLGNKPAFIPTSTYYVEDDDQVHIWYNGSYLTVTSRKLLLEKSAWYRDSMEIHWSKMDFYALPGDIPSECDILQGLQFLHQNYCEYFQSGSYDDVYLHLLPFAEQMKMDELVRACMIELCLKVDAETTIGHIGVIQEYKDWISVDAIEHFRSFFRKNFLTIRQAESFRALLEADDDGSYKDFFVRLAYDPAFSFYHDSNSRDDSENGDNEGVQIEEVNDDDE